MNDGQALITSCLELGLGRIGRIYVYGVSRGGYMALRLAAADPRVCGIVGIAPCTAWQHLEEFAVAIASSENNAAVVEATAIEHYAEALANRPLYLAIGNLDTRVSTPSCVGFANAVLNLEAGQAVGEKKSQVVLKVVEANGHSIGTQWRVDAAQWLLNLIEDDYQVQVPPRQMLVQGGTATKDELASQLRALGLTRGETVFCLSSLGSVGMSQTSGAAMLMSAFDDVLGPEGLLLLPSFNLLDGIELRLSEWDIECSPSTVGFFSDFVWRQPGSARSDHYSHSVCARGERAQEYTSQHLKREGYRSPWDQEQTRFGRTFGSGNPMLRAYEDRGKLLMLGTLYDSSTYLHVVESMLWGRMLQEIQLDAMEQAQMSAAELRDAYAPFPAIDRLALGGWWEGQNQRVIGPVGDAECRLCSIRDYVDACCEQVAQNPWVYLNMPHPHPPGIRVQHDNVVSHSDRGSNVQRVVTDATDGVGLTVSLLRRTTARL